MRMRLWTEQTFLGGIPRFREGREPLEVDEKCGRPKSTPTEVKIAAVAGLVKIECRIASRMTAESLNIPKTAVLRILKEDLGKRNLCARFVPHFLTPEQREDGVTSCQDIVMMADANKNLLSHWGRVTQICVFTLQLCKTGDANLRF